MWKYLGWPLAVAAVAGAYFVYQTSASREAVISQQLQDAQALNVQLSNRLAVVEAQYNVYRLAQEREARERLMREREVNYRAVEPGLEKLPVTTAPVEPQEPDQAAPVKREDPHGRRAGGSGKSIGEGVNSLLDRIRNGLSN